jgi:hypothetical protein
LAETFADADFKGEVERSSLVASPVSREKAAKIVQSVLDTSAEIVSVLQRILKQ